MDWIVEMVEAKLGDRGKRILKDVTRFNNINQLTSKVSLFL